ncbi:glycoside hydrolase superfamily [Chytriomyces sp. MP71]|nr:glycoside hydrolase superfamily [Chytriomyces sp. MP71]
MKEKMEHEHLLGTHCLGQTFTEHSADWLRIDGVVIGESSQFGHSVIRGDSLASVLMQAAADAQVAVVCFDWRSNTGFAKSGFALSNAGDAAEKSGFSVFVRRGSRINLSLKINLRTERPNGFVRWDPDQNQFVLEGRKFVPTGFNAYWLGLTEEYGYPSHPQIEQMFFIARKIAATTIRSHTLGFSSGSKNSLRPGPSNKLNEVAWEPIDFAFHCAEKYGIRLICPLLDAYSYYHGSYGDFCTPRRVPKTDFFTNSHVRAEFKDYVSQWLNHVNPLTNRAIKDDPSLFAIELGNELGNNRPSAGSTAIPTREWIADISSFIKSVDPIHIVLNGSDECLGSATSDDFSIPTLDAFGAHFYSKDWLRLADGCNAAVALRKPFIVGEYSSRLDANWFKTLECNAHKVHGTFFWGLYPNQNGTPSSPPVLHNDGFTLNWIPKDLPFLLILSNHMRRLQGLEEICQFEGEGVQ